MSEYTLSQVSPTDKRTLAQIDALLELEGIRRDGNLDYICAMFDENYNVIGTGSCFGNTLRCFAVSTAHHPFTLGHQYLVETAAAACDTLHLFVVSEDASLVPFVVRKKLVAEGVAHLPNVVLHDSGPYIISNATFPSYFLKDETAVIDGHARLDLAVFTKIAAALNITARYVGEEPTSQVTGLYNKIMCEQLPKSGIDCIVIPRKEANGKAISASTVRQCLQTGDWATLKTLVPQTTLDYFQSPEAAPVLARIRNAGNVVHY